MPRCLPIAIPLTVLVVFACSEDSDSALPPSTQPDAEVIVDPADGGTEGMDAAAMGEDATVEPDMGFADLGPRDSGVIDPNTEPYRTDYDRTEFTVLGEVTPRINIVIAGDGYRIDQLDDEFDDHVDKLRSIWSRQGGNRGVRDVTQPFRHYAEYFNVHRVHVASAESGVDDPGDSVSVDTALDGSLVCEDRVNGPCHVDFAKADAAFTNALRGSGITPDIRVVVLNTSEDIGTVVQTPDGPLVVYGGGIGGNGNSAYLGREVALANIAIAFAGVGTETTGGGTYTGPEPAAPNLTTTATSTKWARWFGYDEPNVEDRMEPISVVEGGGGFDTGLYRPNPESKLNNPNPVFQLGFNAVVREALILKMYEKLPVLVDFSPSNDGIVDNPPFLDVTPLSFNLRAEPPDYENTTFRPIEIEWRIDGLIVEDQKDTRLGFVAVAEDLELRAGNHAVDCRIRDVTPWVRDPARPNMEASVRWEVIYRP